MFLPIQLNVGTVLEFLGSKDRVLPTVIPCYYCNTAGAAHLDLCSGSVNIYCPNCQRTDDTIDILLDMSKNRGYLDYAAAAEYFNSHRLTYHPITPDHFEVYSKYVSEVDRMQTIYAEVRRRFHAKAGSYLRSITTWWTTPAIDPSYVDIVEKSLLVLPVSELAEILDDFPTTNLRTEMVAIVPFYSAVDRICGFLIFNPRQTFYYTTRQTGRGTGIGGCPNFVVPGVYNKLLDNYLIGIPNTQDYLSLLSSSICGVGKRPPTFLIYRGLGYSGGRKYIFSTSEVPSTSRTIVIYLSQPDYYWYKYAVSIGARTALRSMSLRNPTTSMQTMVNSSRAPEDILHFINNTIKHRQPFSLTVNLSKTREFAQLASYYNRIEGRFQALLNRDVALGKTIVQVTDSGVIYKNTYISNYIPALQVITPRTHVFTVRAYGQIFDVAVPTATKKHMMATLPTCFLKQHPRIIIGHDPKFLKMLWELATLIGDNQRIDHVPNITPEGIRLKYQILKPGHPPLAACTIPSAPEFVANYDTGYLTLNTPQEIQTARLALALCGIPLMQFLGKTPYSLVILTEGISRELCEAFSECGIEVLLGHDSDLLLEQMTARYVPGWPLVLTSRQIPHTLLLKHGPGVVLFRHPGIVNPFLHDVALVSMDLDQLQSDRLPKVFGSILAWSIESYSDFKPDDASITSLLYNIVNVMDGPVSHKRSLREGFVYMHDTMTKFSDLHHKIGQLQKLLAGAKLELHDDDVRQYLMSVFPQKDVDEFIERFWKLCERHAVCTHGNASREEN